MGLGQNMQAAQRAVDYVNSRMTAPSSNWPGLSSLQRGSARGVMNETRTAIGTIMTADPNRALRRPGTVGGPVTLQKQVELGRLIATKQGGVHCGEKSVLAFTYLVENGFAAAHVTILNGNHDFVLVNPTPLTYGNKYAVSLRSATDIFGAKCVVCDPWYQGGCVYPVATLWNPNFGNTVRNAKDPLLGTREGWDSAGSLATVISTTYMLECIIYAGANSAIGGGQLPPPLSDLDRSMGEAANFLRGLW